MTLTTIQLALIIVLIIATCALAGFAVSKMYKKNKDVEYAGFGAAIGAVVGGITWFMIKKSGSSDTILAQIPPLESRDVYITPDDYVSDMFDR